MVLPFKARRRLECTKYAPQQQIDVLQGATEHDVGINVGVSADTSFLADIVPMVTLNWLTSYGIEPLPGKADFKTGFRVTFGAPAPSGAKISFAMAVIQ